MKKFPKGIEVVTTAFVIKNNKILLARANKESDIWVFPGGHIEPGEEILKSCEREVEEEIGLNIKAIKVFNFGQAILDNSHFIYFDVLCELEEDQKDVEDKGGDLLDYDWFTIDEALKLEYTKHFKDKLQSYIAYIKE